MYTHTHMYACLYVWLSVRSESESASHSSPPQLKGVRVISAEAYIRLCCHRKKRKEISTHACTCTCVLRSNNFGQTTVIYTHTYTHSHTSNTFTQAQYSVNSHKKHAHSPKRCKIGKNFGCQGRKLVVAQGKFPVSRWKRELGRQLSFTLRKANKQKSNICTCKQVRMFVCMIVWGARANQPHTRHHRSSKGDLCMCVCTCADSWGTCSKKWTNKKQIHSHTFWVKHTDDCAFTNRIYRHTHLQSSMFTCMIVWGATTNQRHTRHHRTFNTFTQAQYSVNSHEKHAHSQKRWKPGKKVGWQGRQLVLFQRKMPVSRRNRELGRQLSCILCTANQQKKSTYIHIHIHTCLVSGDLSWVKI
jgi:hypothetical protein